jgi:hypothetical protein
MVVRFWLQALGHTLLFVSDCLGGRPAAGIPIAVAIGTAIGKIPYKRNWIYQSMEKKDTALFLSLICWVLSIGPRLHLIMRVTFPRGRARRDRLGEAVRGTSARISTFVSWSGGPTTTFLSTLGWKNTGVRKTLEIQVAKSQNSS